MPILTPDERLGQTLLGRYRLDALLSVGGMGVLFRALDLKEAKPVAVKMLKPMHSLEAEHVARFERETRIAQRLRHPNVAHTLDAFRDESGVPFLVMELLVGRSLAQELDERKVLPAPAALAIVLPIVGALEAAHELGIVHRDLKPSNIFLCRDASGGQVAKLLDFGIAKSGFDGFETQTGTLLGTPGYMAPEQIQYGESSPLSDVWGIAAVLHRCLTGYAPHAQPDCAELMSRLVREPVPPLSLPGVSKALCATIDRALARDPHRRYPSMRAFGLALATFAVGETELETGAYPYAPPVDDRANAGGGRGVRPPARHTRVPLLALGAALVVLAITSAGSSTPARMKPGAATLGLEQSRTPMRGVEPAIAQAELHPKVVELRAIDRAPVPSGPRIRSVKPRMIARPAHAASARRPAPIETEATTGLPVATEW